MSWWSRLAHVLRTDRLDQDLEEEQRFHIEARAEELEAQGLSRQAALEQATRRFGPRLLLRESSREVKLLSSVESLWRDLRLGVRLLRKDAVVSLAAVVSLGLAIGACTAAFSLIDALILRQLPVRDPYRLVYVNRAARMAIAVAAGIGVGLAGGVYFARFVRTFLYEVEPISPSSLSLPLVCLLGVALIAAWSPARQATRVDPAEALRTD
jgi:hypothetical protein